MSLDIEQPEQLTAYLHARGLTGAGTQAHMYPLPGGVSNRTVWVDVDEETHWVVKQALGKLRVKVDWFSDPARIHREADGLRCLTRLLASEHLPRLIYEDMVEDVLIIEAIAQPHANWKAMLLAGDVQPDHIDQFARMLATIHTGAWEQRSEFEPLLEDATNFETLRLEPFYAYAGAQVPPAADFLHRLIADTRAYRLTFVHGDYSPKNVLVYHDRLILLDYEVCHWGDPAFDVGFSMAHLLSKAHHLAQYRPLFREAARQCWAAYDGALNTAALRDDLEARAVRHTLGCLLARVAGRSPLEYLDEEARGRQRDAVIALMAAPPDTLRRLIDGFIDRISVP